MNITFLFLFAVRPWARGWVIAVVVSAAVIIIVVIAGCIFYKAYHRKTATSPNYESPAELEFYHKVSLSNSSLFGSVIFTLDLDLSWFSLFSFLLSTWGFCFEVVMPLGKTIYLHHFIVPQPLAFGCLWMLVYWPNGDIIFKMIRMISQAQNNNVSQMKYSYPIVQIGSCPSLFLIIPIIKCKVKHTVNEDDVLSF